MDIWLIKNGEKSGPFSDYEIRSKISHGDLSGEDFIWHEGLPEWTKVRNVEAFQKEFGSADENDEPVKPPELPKEYLEKSTRVRDSGEQAERYLSRRLWARAMDLVVYSAIWWLSMYAVGQNIEAAIQNPWLHLSIYLPWFALEAWLLQRFGTTPGKWMMGLRVQNEDGSLLGFGQSVWRSLRVLITGIGFGWGLLMILCMGMSWFTTRRIGKPIWDFLGGHEVVAKPMNPFKIIGLVVCLFVGSQLQMAVRGPYDEKAIIERYPEMKEFLERDGKWYLPVRN